MPVEIMDPRASAPLPTPDHSPAEFAVTFARLLQDLEIPQEALAIGLATGPVLVYGAKEFVAGANRIVAAGDVSALRAEIKNVLSCLQTLASERSRAFVLRQVAGTLRQAVGAPHSGEPLARFRSPRGYEALFDRALRSSGALAHLDMTSYGRIAIRLDEFYDDSCLQLRRLGELTAVDGMTARQRFADFLQGLYEDYVSASFGDHLFAEESKTGLLQLLPELDRALEGV